MNSFGLLFGPLAPILETVGLHLVKILAKLLFGVDLIENLHVKAAIWNLIIIGEMEEDITPIVQWRQKVFISSHADLILKGKVKVENMKNRTLFPYVLIAFSCKFEGIV